MMKKWCALLFAVCLMMGFALAESAEEQCKEHARNLLTEVYGYTVEESTAFEFETTDENGKLQVRFWPVGRPEWVYSGVFDAESGRFRESQSPFTRGMRMPESYPGESAGREVLRSAQEDSCFQYWHSNDRNELLMVMRKQGVQPTSALMEGIDLEQCVLFSSGRIPDDMIEKAIRARVPVLASNAVPTDRAVELAREYHVTLICTAREKGMDVFSCREMWA